MRIFWFITSFMCWYWIWDHTGWYMVVCAILSFICAGLLSTLDLIVAAIMEGDFD